GHPAGFPVDGPSPVDGPFATVERFAARIKLYPLLERRFEVGSVRIEGARLNLVRGADGRGNWEDFGLAPAPDDAASSEALVENLDIGRIEIRDGDVGWYEEPGRPRYVLGDIALTTGRIRGGEPIDVSLAVNVEDTSSERRFGVETRSLVGLEALRAATNDAVVTLRDFALSLRAYDPTNREIAAGTLETERFDALPDGSVDIGAARFDARLAPAEALPAGLDLGAGWGTLRFDPRAGAFAVDALVTRIAGITAEWQLTARDVIDAPRIEGEVRVVDAAVAATLETLG